MNQDVVAGYEFKGTMTCTNTLQTYNSIAL